MIRCDVKCIISWHVLALYKHPPPDIKKITLIHAIFIHNSLSSRFLKANTAI